MLKSGTAGDARGYLHRLAVPDAPTTHVYRFENLSGGMNRFDQAIALRPGETPFAQNLTFRAGALRSRRGQVQIGTLGVQNVCAAFDALYHGWIVAHAGGQLVAYQAAPGADAAQAPGARQTLYANLSDTPGTFFRYDDALLYKTRGAYLKITHDAAADTLVCADLTQDAFAPCIQINTDPETGAGDLYQPENRLSAKKIVRYAWREGVSVYHLPVRQIDDVVYARAGDVELTKYLHYDFDAAAGTVTFSVTFDPAALPGTNAIEICYAKANDDAYQSILDCTAAAAFGGAQELCVVLAGSEKQPNAYFWSGHTSAAMDPTYFPMSQYNLAGDAAEAITGFGKQQSALVIFQRGSIGRAALDTQTVSGRTQLSMDYTRIHAGVGCDLPGSIRLVGNHLVWACRGHGVCLLKESSAALEQSVFVLSRKLHGEGGLLHALSAAETAQSAITDERYVLFLGSEAYEWNFGVSGADDPSWFFHTGLQGAAYVTAEPDRLFALTARGAVAEFLSVRMDFTQPIEKIYTLPPRGFGRTDRRKSIRAMRFVTCPDTRVNIAVTYTADGMTREEPANLRAGAWSLTMRDLSWRDLGCMPFGRVFRRTPGLRHVAWFGAQLRNAGAGEDLSLIAAEIDYTFQGRQL